MEPRLALWCPVATPLQACGEGPATCSRTACSCACEPNAERYGGCAGALQTSRTSARMTTAAAGGVTTPSTAGSRPTMPAKTTSSCTRCLAVPCRHKCGLSMSVTTLLASQCCCLPVCSLTVLPWLCWPVPRCPQTLVGGQALSGLGYKS